MSSEIKTTNILHPSSGSNNLVLASDGSATINQISSSSVFPAGHVIQIVDPTPVVETNSLTETYLNLHEVSITLEGGSSKILIFHEFQGRAATSTGVGQRVYKKVGASGVQTSDTAVFTLGAADSAGPLGNYYNSETFFTSSNFIVDDASSHNAGNTVYYGFFYRRRSGSADIPINQPTDGYFKTTLLEISG